MKSVHRLNMESKLIPLLVGKDDWGTVLDVGSKDARYSRFMNYDSFTTLDIVKGCDIKADIQCYKSKEKFDTVTCFQVLEHLESPDKAVKNIYDLLVPKGVLLLTVPFIFGEHGNDYHRFTRLRCALLFKDFRQVLVVPYGNFVSSSWQIFNFHNYFGLFNRLVSWFSRMLPFNRYCPDGYLVIAQK